jgi:hypothetical protein
VSSQANEDHNRPARDRTRPSVKQTSLSSALRLLPSEALTSDMWPLEIARCPR